MWWRIARCLIWFCLHYMYSNEALPQPISKRKDKEHKKKKSKTMAALNAAETEVGPKTVNALPEVVLYNTVAPANIVLEKKPGWLRSTKIRNECTRIGSPFIEIQILFTVTCWTKSIRDRWELVVLLFVSRAVSCTLLDLLRVSPYYFLSKASRYEEHFPHGYPLVRS